MTAAPGIPGDHVRGKRVMLTGAGGSIGSELSRLVHRCEPSELMLLDHDESGLHAVQLSIHGRASLDSREVILADIRDRGSIRRIFQDRRPEFVFHAAALKHVLVLEQYPAEAVKTNVGGTVAVLEAARDVGVELFVNISSDKAADPSNVLGYTKRLGEALTAGIGRNADGTYVSVRFGNVLGSRGSVIAVFEAQAARGGPLTVTHPEATRHFMSVTEACHLVLHAAAIGADGEALVLDMGEPVGIRELAKRFIEDSGLVLEVEYTGLRPGERLHEKRLGAHERDERPFHPLISHVEVPAALPNDLGLPRADESVADHLARLCRTLGARGTLKSPVSDVHRPRQGRGTDGS